MALRKYEQLSFVETPKSETIVSHVISCKDYLGNDIHIGDYVTSRPGLRNNITHEGYVLNIIEYEYGAFIKIGTTGGDVIIESACPLDYIVSQK